MSQSRCIALYAVSGFIKYLLLIDYANIYLFSKIFFNRFFALEKGAKDTPHCLYFIP